MDMRYARCVSNDSSNDSNDDLAGLFFVTKSAGEELVQWANPEDPRGPGGPPYRRSALAIDVLCSSCSSSSPYM
jgi:hypothetical protein